MMHATRYHEICCGHRVVGHEGKCRHLHGHNYRIHFVCKADNGQLDVVGRVIDFSVIKQKLCMWLEENWDHKFLLWTDDPYLHSLFFNDNGLLQTAGVIIVPFNPTAENMAKYLVECVGPKQLEGAGVTLVECVVEETTKCSAIYSKDEEND